jgi:putative ABC transport system permease protein
VLFIFRSLLDHPLRTLLSGLGITVGIASVVILTSLGEGVQRYVLAEFSQFGTHIMAVSPGKVQTHGVSGAVIGTVRPLTFADAEALGRLSYVRGVVPFVQGNVEVKFGNNARRAYMNGVGPDLPEVWSFSVAFGRFLPEDDPRAPRAYAVLGSKVRTELFGNQNPLGKAVRIGGERYRVIGVMESKGQFLGFDMDDAVYIPAARALELLNRESLMEIDLLYSAVAGVDEVERSVRNILRLRHGHEDFTIITQEKMLEVLGNVLGVLTFAVGDSGVYPCLSLRSVS